jgi:hypothetical protein
MPNIMSKEGPKREPPACSSSLSLFSSLHISFPPGLRRLRFQGGKEEARRYEVCKESSFTWVAQDAKEEEVRGTRLSTREQDLAVDRVA